ncbi:MAG TPA: DoxX family membrane protein [bacterium]|nr:DoxX family membrane protein [bacterium]
MTEPHPGGLSSGATARIDLALLLLRVILAAVFGAYGYEKWAGGMGRFEALLITVHLPSPALTGRAVATLEAGGAVLLLLGLGTRLVGALLVVEMAVAIAKVVWPQGFIGGFALELTLLTVALALAVAGGGRFSVGCDPLSR